MKRNVLIVNTNSIYSNNATGITLRGLLETINTDKLMEIYWEKEGLDTGIISSSKKITFRNRFKQKVYKKLRNSKINKNIKKQDLKITNKGYSRLLSYIRQYISLDIDLMQVKIQNEIMMCIENFNPEVIYTLGGSVNVLRISYFLSCKLNIPIVIHHMDNWMYSMQWENNPLLNRYKSKLENICRLCYTRTTECLAISPRMADIFTERTGVNHRALMNSINTSSISCKSFVKRTDSYKIIYAGGLHIGRSEAILEIAQTIDQIIKEKRILIEFDIYTSDIDQDIYKENFSGIECVRFFNLVPHDEIFSIYANADVLVHAENLNSHNLSFNRYSISTKIPEYLASGVVVLFYGPKEIYLTEFLDNNALAITASKKDELKQGILKSIYNNAEKKLYISNARAYVEENFNILKNIGTLIYALENSTL